jgi:hypothetical protein
METEEGYTRAQRYNESIKLNDYKHYTKFLTQEIEVQEASEPTDIIWENRSITPRQRTFKRCIVYFVILIMLTISAVIIFVCTLSSNAKKFRYPKVDCEVMAEQYSDKGDLWMNDAINEFSVNYPKQMDGAPTNYQGQMQCYCTD